ncbi:hypothetical protein OBBRIDRAFT_827833 [Obba rivulosa]|uniref:Ricin B lectin domain-containing protein n=1 Tax=Obba rivulosa TaxID=1052685 RepID=A0A8E2AM80_9APHY|nr:hypothetical protein OBBRIDRAFT_827833 [Obba rivulosa]
MTLSNGSYFIEARQQGTLLELTSGAPGMILTTWAYSGEENQQWQVEVDAGLTKCRVSSVQYPFMYVSLPANQSNPSGYQYIESSSEPFDWYFKPANSGYIFSSDPAFFTAWNVEAQSNANNNSVIDWPLDAQFDNSVWVLESTEILSQSPVSSDPTSSLIIPPTPGTAAAIPTMIFPTSTTASTPTASSIMSAQRSTSINTAIIAGVTAGGVVLVLSVAVFSWWNHWCCFRTRNREVLKEPHPFAISPLPSEYVSTGVNSTMRGVHSHPSTHISTVLESTNPPSTIGVGQPPPYSADQLQIPSTNTLRRLEPDNLYKYI